MNFLGRGEKCDEIPTHRLFINTEMLPESEIRIHESENLMKDVSDQVSPNVNRASASKICKCIKITAASSRNFGRMRPIRLLFFFWEQDF